MNQVISKHETSLIMVSDNTYLSCEYDADMRFAIESDTWVNVGDMR